VPCATSRRNHVKSHVFACEAMQHLHAPVQQREQCQDQERTCRHVHEVLCMHTHARTLESDEEIMNCSNIVPPFPEPKWHQALPFCAWLLLCGQRQPQLLLILPHLPISLLGLAIFTTCRRYPAHSMLICVLMPFLLVN
jgi:hypothetical protein